MPGLDGGVPDARSGGGIPHPGSGWGVPHPRSGRGGGCTPSQVWTGGTPSQVWMGGYLGYPPQPGLDGVPSPPHRQSSIASTCYAAGGMPLAFTQEDFLVIHTFPKENCCNWPIFIVGNSCSGNISVYQETGYGASVS